MKTFIERRKTERKDVLFKAVLETKDGKKLPVWLKNLSCCGAKFTIYKSILCLECNSYDESFEFCQDCLLYNLSEILKFTEGKISFYEEGVYKEYSFEKRWHDISYYNDTIDVGVKFLD